MKNLSILLLLVTLISCSDTKEESPVEIATDEIAIISTEFGDIYVVLYDETPQHKANFLKLASEGFYDSTTFHRVMTDFMVQGGDPNSKDDIPQNDGQGGPGYTVEAEFNQKFIHKKGALAAARLGDQQNPERNSSGSQFYIIHGIPVTNELLDQVADNINGANRQTYIRKYVQAPENADILQKLQQFQAAQNIDSLEAVIDRIEPLAMEGVELRTYSEEQRAIYTSIGGYPYLDDNYTVFGEVIKGLAVVDSIAVQEVAAANRPVSDILMKVRVEEMEREKITAEFGYSYN